ncbi:MAG: FtsW/RodA/SpoVE family cell cycle protein [Candidatus Parcubacteria bacterium]|jgi:rod shape determining protein RodA|nr:MAG: FtsW/RodA/SpoVE family cell cycle protein [Candidatus Parcubacteria bacterium]
MKSSFRTYFKNFDWILFFAVFLLAIFGVLEIYSVALGVGGEAINNFYKQLLFIGLGLTAMFAMTFFDHRFLRSLRAYLYWLAVLLLILVLIFGKTVNNTTGWFEIFNFRIQPVEFVKIILLIYLAGYFSNLATRVKNSRHFLTSLGATLVLFVLVGLQPDFGSSLVLLAIWLIVALMAGFNKKYWLITFLVALVGLIPLWFNLSPYQKQRVTTVFNSAQEVCREEECYNKQQALIAIGAGGLAGRGLGFGSQSQLKFLPAAQTDFIFSVIAEELGFLGILIILGLFMIFFYRGLSALRKIKDDFGIYFILGYLGLVFTHMFVNIGMNLGLLPIVGIPLPFVSYGGSALIAMFLGLGIVQNIIIKSKINY